MSQARRPTPREEGFADGVQAACRSIASDALLERLFEAVREEVQRARGRGHRQEVHVLFVIGADGHLTAESEVRPAHRRPLKEKA